MGIFSTEVEAVLPKVLLPCLGGPVMFAWGVALPGGETSTWSGEGCHHLGLGEGSSKAEKEPWGRKPAQRRMLLVKG